MDLISLAKNPVPSGARAGILQSYDGTRLRYATWQATRRPLRGTACLFPGRGEFIEKYFEVVADLRRRGFAVAVLDWRGQGGSERKLDNPLKGHVRDFDEYDADLRRFMVEIVLPDCPAPYTALAHSMGGAILLRNAVEPGSWFDRMVLTAPMIAFASKKVGYPQWLAKAYGEIGCAIGFRTAFVHGGSEDMPDLAHFEGNALTSDRERWTRARAVLDVAPQLRLGSPTINWVRAAYRNSARLLAPGYPTRVHVPVLVFAAGADEIVSARVVEDFGVQLKVGKQILLPGSRHEIMMEDDAIRARFWAAFDAYLGVAQIAA